MKSGPLPPLLTVLHRSGDLVLGEAGNTCVALWRAKPTLASFQVQRSALARIVGAAPGKAAFLCVVESDCEPPEEPLRKASSDMINIHGPRLGKVACVIEGRGFKAAITRSVLSGMQLIIRSSADIKFFRSPFEGALWVESEQDAARELVRAVEALRAQPLPQNRRAAAGG
jgi:hypothetical protein